MLVFEDIASKVQSIFSTDSIVDGVNYVFVFFTNNGIGSVFHSPVCFFYITSSFTK